MTSTRTINIMKILYIFLSILCVIGIFILSLFKFSAGDLSNVFSIKTVSITSLFFVIGGGIVWLVSYLTGKDDSE